MHSLARLAFDVFQKRASTGTVYTLQNCRRNVTQPLTIVDEAFFDEEVDEKRRNDESFMEADGAPVFLFTVTKPDLSREHTSMKKHSLQLNDEYTDCACIARHSLYHLDIPGSNAWVELESNRTLDVDATLVGPTMFQVLGFDTVRATLNSWSVAEAFGFNKS